MKVTVQLTYDMSKELGVQRFELEDAKTVADVVRLTRSRFEGHEKSFEDLSRVAAVAVNGVLVNYRKGAKTTLEDGDTVAFVKAAAGG